MNPVTIKKDSLGNAVRQSRNPEYGYVVVQQEKVVMSTTGWVNRKIATALVKGKLEDLLIMFKNLETLPGQIVTIEQLEPLNPENLEQGMKIAGDTGVVCCVDGQPIYRTSLYTTDLTMQDKFIAHDNSDEIKSANNSKVKTVETDINAEDAVSVETGTAMEAAEEVNTTDSFEESEETFEENKEEVVDVEEDDDFSFTL